MNRIILGFAAMILAAAPSVASAAAFKAGDYRLVAATPLGELPINLKLEQKNGAWTAAYVNGPEVMAAEATTVAGDALTVSFPSYGSRLEAKVDDAGALSGTLIFTRASGSVEVPVTGRAGVSHRFFPDAAKEYAGLNGRWAVTVPASADGKSAARPGIGEFTQAGNKVHGAIMYVNADTRWLAGEVRGNEVYMSIFDGGTGSLMRATLQPDGTLTGSTLMLVGNLRTDWTAKKDATAALPDPTKLTYLKPGYDKFEFSFPDLDGKMVSLDDPRFKGKVTIITIGGTWCPTCHDEAAFMAPFIRENRARGVEGVALQYEFSADFAKAAQACRNFAKRYGIDFPMLIAGTNDKEAASRTLPMINAVLVYPTMIVVDRKGRVRNIHTSFPGPATGVHHENFKREFKQLIDGLVAEGV
jgi:peroxiredoxin